jgi:putative ABC transport system permease protein
MSTTRLAGHSLRMMGRYKLRSSFMMLGSLLGVAALTLVISVGQAAQRKMLKTVGQMFGDSSVMIFDGGGHMMGGPRSPGTRLKIDDIEAVAKELPGIEAWDPLQALSGASVRRGGVTDSARVLGQSERSEQVWGRTASRGEFFDATAVTGSARVAVIGETVANELFKNEDPIGADIEIGSVPFRVIGVLQPWGTDPHGMDRDNEVVVPISTLMRRLTNVDTISAAKLLVTDPARAKEMTKGITRILRERHALAAGQPDDFSILTATQVRQMVTEVRRVMFLYLPLVAAVALVVGGIVSASLMLASVNERVAEIGLRRAVGARSEDIRLQFLLETAATTLAGGIGGIVLGYFGAQLGASRMHLGHITPWTAALIGVIASTVVGFAAGLLPALRAARLSPAEALR